MCCILLWINTIDVKIDYSYFFLMNSMKLSFKKSLENINDINNFSIKNFFSISVFLECDYLMNAHVSGLFSVIGLVVYPVGWGTKRVRDLCGEYADPYVIDSCSIGEFCTIFEFYVIVSCTVVR